MSSERKQADLETYSNHSQQTLPVYSDQGNLPAYSKDPKCQSSDRSMSSRIKSGLWNFIKGKPNQDKQLDTKIMID
jgi:hypothetical protein